MSVRSDVPPETLSVELREDGIAVDYTDGRRVYYLGVPASVTESVRVAPEKEAHVLVTDPSGTEGVMVYVNDRKTHDDILESTGVGRVLLDPGEEDELFPGVTVRLDGYAIIVDADPDVARGRVFLFEEDELGERSYEFVTEE